MDWETLERKQVQSGWRMIAAGVLVLYLFAPVGLAMGWMGGYASPSFTVGRALSTFFIGLPFVALGIYLLLVAPFVKSGFLIPQEKPARLLGAFVLWGLPLFSFAYWRGDFGNSLHAYDVAMFLTAALGLPLIAYWRTGNAAALSVGIALIAFIPMFVFEDILGPFSPLWFYASLENGLYILRTLSLGAALLTAALLPMPRIGRVRNRQAVFGLVLVLLGVLSLAIVAGESRTQTHLLAPSLFRPDLNWVAYLGLLFFAGRTDRFSERAFVILGAVQMASLLAQLVHAVWNPEPSLWMQFRLLGIELGSVVIGLEIRRRLRTGQKKSVSFSQVQSHNEPLHSS